MRAIYIIMVAVVAAIIVSFYVATTPEAFIFISFTVFAMAIVSYFIGYTWEHRAR